MSSRDAFLSQSCLRTRRPEPMVNPEAKPVRKCERCGCKLASDTGPYRGRLLCSPCLAPIQHVATGVSAVLRERILLLCSGMTTEAIGAMMGIGASTASSSMTNVAKDLGINGPTLRKAVTWAIGAGLLAPKSALPVTPLQAAEREYQAAVDALAEMVAPLVVPLFLRCIRAAHEYGKLGGGEAHDA